MIIDVHGHVTAPMGLYAYKAELLASRGSHGRGRLSFTDDQIREALQAPLKPLGGMSHLDQLDEVGIDLQLTSPRPFQSMHSEDPPTIVEWFCEATNDVIAQVCSVMPDRFRGVAGLPQSPDRDPAQWTKELRRCVQELGFVGCLLNPDPYEGTKVPPALGDRYWYPVYEALCELDVPAMIHSAGCRAPARESYSVHFVAEETIAIISLLSSDVFRDFPTLKIIVPHGGGAVPYQVGRFQSTAERQGASPFLDRLRQLWFDCTLYTQDAVELLIRAVGADRVLLGTEKPGVGSAKDPTTGRWYDDVPGHLRAISWLGDEDRDKILTGNAQALFRL
ncbi:MAG: amidohydrolase family protein [Streptosporangiales bacterium]|nr:amidohydrolase family protein [Streptosporangiales bacterium]